MIKMRQVFLSLLLLVLIVEVILGQCLETNLQSKGHSIRKRNVNHWCSAKGCNTCVGRDCQQTCKGFTCGDCPSGNCCDGTKCNACYNSSCCSTPSCNYCIKTCREACFNDTACLNVCIPQCQNGTNDVFVVQPNTVTPGQPDVMVYINGVPHKGRVTSGTIPTSNKTGTVTVNGVDHPATVLVLVPTTPQTKPVPSLPCNNNPSSGNIIHPTNNNQRQGCCHVVHPQQCYSTHTYPYRHCFRRSHQECSNLCSSQFVHLVPNLAQPYRQAQCHYVNTYPYVYCGQHSVQNCDPCYVCRGQYNPNFCVQQQECSNSCKQTFTPPILPRSPNQQLQPIMGPYQPLGHYQRY